MTWTHGLRLLSPFVAMAAIGGLTQVYITFVKIPRLFFRIVGYGDTDLSKWRLAVNGILMWGKYVLVGLPGFFLVFYFVGLGLLLVGIVVAFLVGSANHLLEMLTG